MDGRLSLARGHQCLFTPGTPTRQAVHLFLLGAMAFPTCWFSVICTRLFPRAVTGRLSGTHDLKLSYIINWRSFSLVPSMLCIKYLWVIQFLSDFFTLFTRVTPLYITVNIFYPLSFHTRATPPCVIQSTSRPFTLLTSATSTCIIHRYSHSLSLSFLISVTHPSVTEWPFLSCTLTTSPGVAKGSSLPCVSRLDGAWRSRLFLEVVKEGQLVAFSRLQLIWRRWCGLWGR